ncbi:hypothetical protein [Cronobacter sakazakii]|nr:hypothetical protein [Cronobacter sakazakii]
MKKQQLKEKIEKRVVLKTETYNAPPSRRQCEALHEMAGAMREKS